MSNQPLTTKPLDSYHKKLKDKYAESFAEQSNLMNKLAQQLLSLELAIPGLYATFFKLIRSDKSVMQENYAIYAAFGLWLISLILNLVALIPRKWKVNRELLVRNPESKNPELGIEDFFLESACYKRRLIIASTVLFFLGIASAFFDYIA